MIHTEWSEWTRLDAMSSIGGNKNPNNSAVIEVVVHMVRVEVVLATV
jgi:hypothetical protein